MRVEKKPNSVTNLWRPTTTPPPVRFASFSAKLPVELSEFSHRATLKRQRSILASCCTTSASRNRVLHSCHANNVHSGDEGTMRNFDGKVTMGRGGKIAVVIDRFATEFERQQIDSRRHAFLCERGRSVLPDNGTPVPLPRSSRNHPPSSQQRLDFTTASLSPSQASSSRNYSYQLTTSFTLSTKSPRKPDSASSMESRTAALWSRRRRTIAHRRHVLTFSCTFRKQSQSAES